MIYTVDYDGIRPDYNGLKEIKVSVFKFNRFVHRSTAGLAKHIDQ